MRKHQSINENKFAPFQAGDCVTKIAKMKTFNIDLFKTAKTVPF